MSEESSLVAGSIQILSHDRSRLRIKVGDVPGEYLTCTFHRTNRLPYEGGPYPLPPSKGTFPLERVSDHLNRRLPPNWVKYSGIFFPMNDREAFWINFSNEGEYAKAIKMSGGQVNVLTGAKWTDELQTNPQDYLVVGHPGADQPWIDGHHVGPGQIRQFVATPKGSGKSVEAQLTGEEKYGGIQMLVYLAKNPVCDVDAQEDTDSDTDSDSGASRSGDEEDVNEMVAFSPPQEEGGDVVLPSLPSFGTEATAGVTTSSTSGATSCPDPDVSEDVSGDIAAPAPPTQVMTVRMAELTMPEEEPLPEPAPEPEPEPAPFVPPPKIKRSVYYVGGKAVGVDWGEAGINWESPFRSNDMGMGIGHSHIRKNKLYEEIQKRKAERLAKLIESGGELPPPPPPAPAPPRRVAPATIKQYPLPKQSKNPQEMCLSAGGLMNQEILPDPAGLDYWNQENPGSVLWIHLVSTRGFFEVTGKRLEGPMPESWTTDFAVAPIADPNDVAVPEVMAGIKGLGELDAMDDENKEE